MPDISFGWTRDLLPDMGGCKEETRRTWTERHRKMWQNQFDATPLKWHKAFNKAQMYGGEQIGWIQLKERPYLQHIYEMDSAAVAREGHPGWTPTDFLKHYFWKPNKKWTPEQAIAEWTKLLNTEVVVIRFHYMIKDPVSDALVANFPHSTPEDINSFFWNATPFPAGNDQAILDSIDAFVARGATSITNCIDMAMEDMDQAMVEHLEKQLV